MEKELKEIKYIIESFDVQDQKVLLDLFELSQRVGIKMCVETFRNFFKGINSSEIINYYFTHIKND